MKNNHESSTGIMTLYVDQQQLPDKQMSSLSLSLAKTNFFSLLVYNYMYIHILYVLYIYIYYNMYVFQTILESIYFMNVLDQFKLLICAVQ